MVEIRIVEARRVAGNEGGDFTEDVHLIVLEGLGLLIGALLQLPKADWHPFPQYASELPLNPGQHMVVSGNT